MIGSAKVERVLRDPRVKAATLTGSEPYRSVASIAGDEIKPTVLELGGSDPFVVMPSADIEAAARTAAESRCLTNGQSCISAKRFIVDIGCADEFERLFVENMRAQKVGDPMDDSTDVGPSSARTGAPTSRRWSRTRSRRARRCCAAGSARTVPAGSTRRP